MVKRMNFPLSLAALALFLASCAQPGVAVKRISEADAGSTIDLRQGDFLEVSLTGNPTTGYTWVAEPGVEALLQAQGDWQFKPDSSALGSGGTMTLSFKAVSTGEAHFKLDYLRTFEPGVPPVRTFEVVVAVGK